MGLCLDLSQMLFDFEAFAQFEFSDMSRTVSATYRSYERCGEDGSAKSDGKKNVANLFVSRWSRGYSPPPKNLSSLPDKGSRGFSIKSFPKTRGDAFHTEAKSAYFPVPGDVQFCDLWDTRLGEMADSKSEAQG